MITFNIFYKLNKFQMLHLSHATESQQKRFYDRETNSAAFCVQHPVSIKTPFLSMQLK